MSKVICSKCHAVYDNASSSRCPKGHNHPVYDFKQSEDFLNEKVRMAKEERKNLGLDGLVKDLNSIIINVELENIEFAAEEFIKYTGYCLKEYFENDKFKTVVLGLENSADIVLRARKTKENPFRKFNLNPKSEHIPNTRLETFVFETTNIKKYFEIQKKQELEFMSDEVIEFDNYYFIQTKPSSYVNISYGIIEWKSDHRKYKSKNDSFLKFENDFEKKDYLKNIGFFDHSATRVRADERDAAIIEFMKVTNYDFSMAIYVKKFNSITNVARFEAPSFSMVFTSGIVPFISLEDSGPTEKFIFNYGTRTHHLAFKTENIEDTYEKLAADGMRYLVELVGSPEQGLKQTFTEASDFTLLVFEYIHRYGDFKGFFTKNNVTKLTESTDRQ